MLITERKGLQWGGRCFPLPLHSWELREKECWELGLELQGTEGTAGHGKPPIHLYVLLCHLEQVLLEAIGGSHEGFLQFLYSSREPGQKTGSGEGPRQVISWAGGSRLENKTQRA